MSKLSTSQQATIDARRRFFESWDAVKTRATPNALADMAFENVERRFSPVGKIADVVRRNPVVVSALIFGARALLRYVQTEDAPKQPARKYRYLTLRKHKKE